MKHFFSQYIEIETLVTSLDELDLSVAEKAHLAALIDSSLHAVILDEILNNLSDGDKTLFLEKLEKEKDHDKIMEFLNEKIDNVSDRIKKVSSELVAELHEDLREVSKIK